MTTTTEWRPVTEQEARDLARQPDLVGYFNEMGEAVITQMSPKKLEMCDCAGLNLIFSKPVMDAVRRLS